MPVFTLTTHAAAPVEEVWKLLHDPARYPERWEGVETVVTGADGVYTMWPTGYPDFPMAQRMRTEPGGGRVTISCLMSDLLFIWQLRADGETTDVEVHVELPERETHRLADQLRLVARSLENLAPLASRVTPA